MGGPRSTHGENEERTQHSDSKPEGKKLLGRSRRISEYNIRTDLRGRGLISLVTDRDQWRVLVNTIMNLRLVP
jgi:hypothetical protein